MNDEERDARLEAAISKMGLTPDEAVDADEYFSSGSPVAFTRMLLAAHGKKPSLFVIAEEIEETEAALDLLDAVGPDAAAEEGLIVEGETWDGTIVHLSNNLALLREGFSLMVDEA